MIWYRVNIARPHPMVKDENKRIIEYIEPLREAGKVQVSDAYFFNLEQHRQGKPCSLSPGYMYYFWFDDRFEASRFLGEFPELTYTREAYAKLIETNPAYKDYVEKRLSDIVEVNIEEEPLPEDVQ